MMSKYKRRRVKLKDHATQGARHSKSEAWLRKQHRKEAGRRVGGKAWLSGSSIVAGPQAIPSS